uniref:Helix-turn-helix transcriptional regulator n=1 Tax=Bosea sp. NBC_00436 TaxID=2969620 RepID=A0A9E7ZTS8_9HYPH
MLGQKVGVSQQQISEYENGADRISLEMLTQLGLIFGKAFDQYIAEKEAAGFSTPEAPPYMLDLPASAPLRPNSNRVETMFLDLRKLRNPADRKSLQSQYMTMLRKQEKA